MSSADPFPLQSRRWFNLAHLRLCLRTERIVQTVHDFLGSVRDQAVVHSIFVLAL